MNNVMTTDGFSIVTKKSKMCARRNRKGIDPRFDPSNSSAGTEDNISASQILEDLRICSANLEASLWFMSVMHIFRDFGLYVEDEISHDVSSERNLIAEEGKTAEVAMFEDMVCYGIGHFGTALASRVQVLLKLFGNARFCFKESPCRLSRLWLQFQICTAHFPAVGCSWLFAD